MFTVSREIYQTVVRKLLTSSDISLLRKEFRTNMDLYCSILKDISYGNNSKNSKYVDEIARKEKVASAFIHELANTALSYFEEKAEKNYYEILGVNTNSTTEQIRSKWLELIKENHPDKVGDSGVDITTELNEAYEVLKDPFKRTEFDFKLFQFLPVTVETEFKRFFSVKHLLSFASIILVCFILLTYYLQFTDSSTISSTENYVANENLSQYSSLDEIADDSNYRRDVDDIIENIDTNKVGEKKSLQKIVDKKELNFEDQNNKKFNIAKQAITNEADHKSTLLDENTIESINNSKEKKEDINYKRPLPKNTAKVTSSKRETKIPAIKKISKKIKTLEKPKVNPKITSRIQTKEINLVDSAKNEVNSNVALLENSQQLPDKSSLYLFVSDYVSAYKDRDINKITKLFLSNAKENGADIENVINKYRKNFSSFDIIRYDIKIKNVSLNSNIGDIDSAFKITFKDKNNDEIKNSTGNISWKLNWISDRWKIKEINYKVD